MFFKRQTPCSLQEALLEAGGISWDYETIRNHAVSNFSEQSFFSKVEQVINKASAAWQK